MESETLNRTLAANLHRLMELRGFSARELATLAGVSPNTVGNYIKLAQDKDHQYISKYGKEPSATLANLGAIARALGVSPLLLLMTDGEVRRLAAQALKMTSEIVDAQLARRESAGPSEAPDVSTLELLDGSPPTEGPPGIQKRRGAEPRGKRRVARKP